MNKPRGAFARRAVIGSVGAVALAIVLASVMFPLRVHLNVATSALVLVIPVVVGVAVGGFIAGAVATGAGFLLYDLVFIPPYYTLSVGAAQNWVALAVYAVVMVVVARVVARVKVARTEAQERAAEVRRLFDLSELLVREAPMGDLLHTIVTAVRHAFDLDGAALLLPVDGRLDLVASDGQPLSEGELQHLSVATRVPVSLETAVVEPGGVQAVALAASGQAIGLLALRGLTGVKQDHELLRAFANHLALALERAQLREQAMRAQLLDEIDRLRRALVGAVSHDLRTPLATIKVAASTLLDSQEALTDVDAKELVGLIDQQADRLNRLVSNLLDMTRIQSGALELRRRPTALTVLLDEALAALGSSADVHRVRWDGPADLPDVDVDPVLDRPGAGQPGRQRHPLRPRRQRGDRIGSPGKRRSHRSCRGRSRTGSGGRRARLHLSDVQSRRSRGSRRPGPGDRAGLCGSPRRTDLGRGYHRAGSHVRIHPPHGCDDAYGRRATRVGFDSTGGRATVGR